MKLLAIVMKKYNRQSPIVFLLTLILGISALLIPIFGAIEMIEKITAGKSDEVFKPNFDDLC
jgi:hypothetical protein